MTSKKTKKSGLEKSQRADNSLQPSAMPPLNELNEKFEALLVCIFIFLFFSEKYVFFVPFVAKGVEDCDSVEDNQKTIHPTECLVFFGLSESRWIS
jgi:hypothetical protein